MKRLDRWRWLRMVVTVGILLAGSVSLAQDEEEEEEEIEQVRIQLAFEIGVENFDQWVYGSARNAKGGRSRMESQLRLRVESVDRACNLTGSQKKKIELAGRGDIKRFMGDVEIVRVKFLAVRRDQKRFNRIWQEIQPLQVRLQAGIFGEQSLTHKVTKRTLDAEQAADYRTEELKRRRFRYRAIIGLSIAMMEDGMPLREDQRVRFTELLIDKTAPPLKFGPNDHNVVMYRAAKLPTNQLRPIFDDAQWRALKQHLDRAVRLERHLRKNGAL